MTADETNNLILVQLRKIRSDVETIKDVLDDHGIQLTALNGRVDVLVKRVDRIERIMVEK